MATRRRAARWVQNLVTPKSNHARARHLSYLTAPFL